MAAQSSWEEMEGWDMSEMVGVCSGLSQCWSYIWYAAVRGEKVLVLVKSLWTGIIHQIYYFLVSSLGAIGPHLAQPVSVNLAPICTTATILENDVQPMQLKDYSSGLADERCDILLWLTMNSEWQARQAHSGKDMDLFSPVMLPYSFSTKLPSCLPSCLILPISGWWALWLKGCVPHNPIPPPP